MSNIIGIDVGKMSLDCAWLHDLDQDKPKRKKVENSPQGFKSMLTWVQNQLVMFRASLRDLLGDWIRNRVFHRLQTEI